MPYLTIPHRDNHPAVIAARSELAAAQAAVQQARNDADAGTPRADRLHDEARQRLKTAAANLRSVETAARSEATTAIELKVNELRHQASQQIAGATALGELQALKAELDELGYGDAVSIIDFANFASSIQKLGHKLAE